MNDAQPYRWMSNALSDSDLDRSRGEAGNEIGATIPHRCGGR